MKIDVYSHAIRVKGVNTDRDLQAMMSFCRPLVEMGFEKKGKRFIPKGLRTYASATRDRREFGFHRNQLQALKHHLFKVHGYSESHVPLTFHDVKDIETYKCTFDVRQMHNPRERQVGIIDYVLDEVTPKWDPIIKMVTLQTGGGKSLSDETNVLMFDGTKKTIKDLEVGDKLLAPDGTQTAVLGKYPQGDRQIYRVTFEDGRWVDADLEHLWSVKVDGCDEVYSTADILSAMHSGKSMSIPTVAPTGPLAVKANNTLKRIKGSLREWISPGSFTGDKKTLDEIVDSIRALGGVARIHYNLGGDDTVVYDLKPNDRKLTILSIKPIMFGPATCIAVDHVDRLFVVDDFIVTHNTFVAQYCMNQLNARTVIHFKGGYVERWKDDLEETFNFNRGEFLIVRGSKDLANLQTMALEGELKAKVIIITSGTMRDYIKNYEDSNGKSKTYPIAPIDFYPKLGVGFRVTDELHQEFHNNYRIDLYTHVPKSLGLSATMVSSDAFKNKVYDIAYPVTQRHDGGGYNVYIGVMTILYHLDPEVKIRYMGGQGYNHTTFEESIMRHKGLLKNYLKIVEHAFWSRYYQVREEGQKALIFFARVDLCTLFVERLRNLYPELTIARYVGSEGDSYEELLEADVGVTTIGSGGTAIDIKNLRTSFMTTAVDSRQSNEQVLGRTRPLKDWPDVTPEFVYFGCMEIEQHMKYHNNKKEVFRGKVLSHGEMISRYTLTLNNSK